MPHKPLSPLRLIQSVCATLISASTDVDVVDETWGYHSADQYLLYEIMTLIMLFRTLLVALILVVFFTTAFAAPLNYREQSFTVAGGTWQLKLPVGYKLEQLVALNGPRLMTFDEHGNLLIGSKSGQIDFLSPPYRHARIYAKLSGYPHSVALRDGVLFVARSDGLYFAPYRPDDKSTLEDEDFVLLAALPSGGGHSSRSVGIGPDQRIYASLGISGNCSDEYLDESYSLQKRRGGLLVLVEPGKGKRAYWKTYASGLRNPIGFDWHPETGVLYASNHGPDHLGYEQPPEYFSRLEAGSFHGMPWFQFDGHKIKRDHCIEKAPPRQDVTAPIATFPARNGPMGVAFAPRASAWAGDAVVALHGSWGTQPHGGFVGARSSRRPPWIARVRFEEGEATGGVEALLKGLQDGNGNRLVRPAGVTFGPDGILYFTSDGGALEGLFRLRRM